MKATFVEITQVVDDSAYPPLVECLLVDAQGQAHRFVEKEAIVSSTTAAVGVLPVHAAIACEVELEWVDSEGHSVVRAGTTRPWGVHSTAGTSNFVVFAEQLREA